jgi:hypothetical protein
MASTSIEQALDVKLRAYGTGSWLATLTGGLHAYSAPDGAVEPYAFYNVISDPTDEESFELTDTGIARVQFDFVCATKGGKSIALAARKILNHLAQWTDGVSVISITCDGVRDIELTGNAWQFQFDAMVEYARA